MGLGQLYVPSGLALETAKFVLEVETPYACNVATGCQNRCGYCYGPISLHVKREEWGKIVQPKHDVKMIIEAQYRKGLTPRPQGVFFSFLTDPLVMPQYHNTVNTLRYLSECNVRTATLSKMTIPPYDIANVRAGMTIVSFDEEFWQTWEPNTRRPLQRLNFLKMAEYPWVSMEPYPPSSIWKQDFGEFIENFKFVNAIIFGMWNYDLRSRSDEARREYRDLSIAFEDFCQTHKIRYYVKSDTLNFITGQKSSKNK